MSPWFQQLIFIVTPALAAALLLRPVIEGFLLRTFTAAVIAAAIFTASALVSGHGEPLLAHSLPLSLGIGFVIALVAGWLASLKNG